MACEFSVLALAVGSFSRFKKIFWAGGQFTPHLRASYYLL